MARFCVHDGALDLDIEYYVRDEAASPFHVGIYQSEDGIKPGLLLTTKYIDDPALLAVSQL